MVCEGVRTREAHNLRDDEHGGGGKCLRGCVRVKERERGRGKWAYASVCVNEKEK